MGVWSDSAGLMFCHVPKGAGWSVKGYLRDNIPDLKGQTEQGLDQEERNGLPKGHLTVREMCQMLAREPEDFGTILAVLRDPYEQQFAQWHYWRDMRIGKRRAMLPQHEVAVLHPTFEAWLEDPRSQYHVYYEPHDRDETGGVPQPTGETYDQYGGFYRYWLGYEGSMPENLEMIQLENLDERMPEIVAEATGEEPDGEVPHANEGPDKPPLEDALTPKAARLIEKRFRWYFDREGVKRRSLEMEPVKV